MSKKAKKSKKPDYLTQAEAIEQESIRKALSGLKETSYSSKSGDTMIIQSAGARVNQPPAGGQASRPATIAGAAPRQKPKAAPRRRAPATVAAPASAGKTSLG